MADALNNGCVVRASWIFMMINWRSVFLFLGYPITSVQRSLGLKPAATQNPARTTLYRSKFFMQIARNPMNDDGYHLNIVSQFLPWWHTRIIHSVIKALQIIGIRNILPFSNLCRKKWFSYSCESIKLELVHTHTHTYNRNKRKNYGFTRVS